MRRPSLALAALAAALVIGVEVRPAGAIPAFARQFDLQCSVCHTRPPRLNAFGEQVHLMGFQIPSAARPGGLLESLRVDGPARTLIDSLALRISGGLFESTASPRETENAFAPPDEFTLYVGRALAPDLSVFAEFEAEPNALVFEDGRYFTRGQVGLGHEAFFMLNLGRLLGLLGAPTMEMGGMTMVGRHGGFNMHGPMLMAGRVDPSTNFSYATNRQLILDTEAEAKHGEIERLPVVPYAFASKFFGLFRDREEKEPQLVTDQVMYNTRGLPGADFHAMFLNNLFLGQAGFLAENEGFDAYAVARMDLGETGGATFNVSVLANWGFGVARAPDPEDHDRPGARLDRLRYGVAANARWRRLDVYGAVIWDKLVGVPDALGHDFEKHAAGLTMEIDYLVLESVMVSARVDQLWAGGLADARRDGSVLTAQIRYSTWQNVAFFVRDSVNLRSFVEDNALRNWRNQLFVGVDWDF